MNLYLSIGVVVGVWFVSQREERESAQKLLTGTADDPELSIPIYLLIIALCSLFWPVVILGTREES